MKSLAEVTRIKSEVERDWLKEPGVTGVGVGYRVVEGKKTEELVIRVYVADEGTRIRLKLPKTVQGVLIEVTERRFELH